MCTSVHIRIDPNSHRGLTAQTGGTFVQRQHFLGRFKVKHQDTRLECIRDFLSGFSHP